MAAPTMPRWQPCPSVCREPRPVRASSSRRSVVSIAHCWLLAVVVMCPQMHGSRAPLSFRRPSLRIVVLDKHKYVIWAMVAARVRSLVAAAVRCTFKFGRMVARLVCCLATCATLAATTTGSSVLYSAIGSSAHSAGWTGGDRATPTQRIALSIGLKVGEVEAAELEVCGTVRIHPEPGKGGGWGSHPLQPTAQAIYKHQCCCVAGGGGCQEEGTAVGSS